jgi:hypothetical protein
MKKTLLILPLVFLFLCGCEDVDTSKIKRMEVSGNIVTRSIDLDDYQNIFVAGPIQITLVQNGNSRAEIETYESMMDLLYVRVINETLVLFVPDTASEYGVDLYDSDLEEISRHALLSGSRIKWPQNKKVLNIRLSFSELEKIRIVGESEIRTDGILRANTLDLEVAGALYFNAEMVLDEFTAAIAGAANLDLRGRAVTFNLECAGAGTVKAFEFISDHVSMDIAGMCNANVYARESIRADIAGVGNIKYKGNPSRVDFERAGFGRIRQIESERIDI